MINTMENIAPEELAALDLFQNCRLCLAKDKVSVDIFNEAAEVRLLYCKIVSCLPLHFSKEDDKLPRKICTQCNEKVDNFYNFWTLTAKTQKTLLDWVQQREIVTTKIKTENIAPSEISFKQEYIDNSDVDDNDRYDDDNESEEDVEPTTVVKTLCDETDGESAGPSTVNIKSAPVQISRKMPTIPLFNLVQDSELVPVVDIVVDQKDQTKYSNKAGSGKTDNTKHNFAKNPKYTSTFICPTCGKSFGRRCNLVSHLVSHSNDKPFNCELCEIHFKRQSGLIAHLERKHPEIYKQKTIVCDMCPQAFYTKNLLENHRLTHFQIDHKSKTKDLEPKDTRTFICHTCGKSFGSRDNIVSHLVIHNDNKPFSCELCQKRFKRKHDVIAHLKRKHPDIYKEKTVMCDMCPKAFHTNNLLENHRLIKHKIDFKIKTTDSELKDTQTSNFPTPGRSFGTRHQLDSHLRSHRDDKQFTCELCQKHFKYKSTLVNHQRHVHEGIYKQKTILCDMCPKAFHSKSLLENHRLFTHLRIKPFKCDLCEKGFRDKRNLNDHILVMHKGLKIKRSLQESQCESCGKSFATRKSLYRHLRFQHGGEKPTCTICGKTLYSTYGLQDHMTIHTGEMPFSCDICGRSFRRKRYLIKHVRIHTGESPFSCSVCGKSFKQSYARKLHMKTHNMEDRMTTDS